MMVLPRCGCISATLVQDDNPAVHQAQPRQTKSGAARLVASLHHNHPPVPRVHPANQYPNWEDQAVSVTIQDLLDRFREMSKVPRDHGTWFEELMVTYLRADPQSPHPSQRH